MKYSGFTLLELIVYVAVLAVLGGVVASLFLWSVQAYTKSRVIQETVTGSQLAMDTVLREVREAERIYLPTSSATQVSLESTVVVPSGEITGFADFFLCGQRLCMKREEQAPVALTPESLEVTALEFVFISTDTEFPSLRMVMETAYVNPHNRPELASSVELTGTSAPR